MSEELLEAKHWDWARRCTGGASRQWCGKQATVICTEVEPFVQDDSPLLPGAEQLGRFQWYACDDPLHRQSPRDPDATVETTPVAQWAAQVADWIDRRERERDRLIALDILTGAQDIQRGRGRLGYG